MSDELIVEAKPIGMGFDTTPTTYQWVCHYCKRGFETAGIAGFKAPKVMVSAECSTAYDNKVEQGYQLKPHEHGAAVKTGSLPESKRREYDEILTRWEQLMDTTNPYERAKYLKMISLVRRTRASGIESAPQPRGKQKFK